MKTKSARVTPWRPGNPLAASHLNQGVRAHAVKAGLVLPQQQNRNPSDANEQSDQTTPVPDIKIGKLDFFTGIAEDITIPIYDTSDPPVQIGTATAEKMTAMYLKRGSEIFLVTLE